MAPIYGFYFAAANRLFGNVAVNAMTADITNRECRRFAGQPAIWQSVQSPVRRAVGWGLPHHHTRGYSSVGKHARHA